MPWPMKRLGDLVEFLDHRRRPITASDRRPGPYPYYGANGLQDHVADFIFDEPLVLLAEDGGHFDAPSRGIAYSTVGKCWVNNHAHVLRPMDMVDHRFLTRALENLDVRRHVTGTTRAKLTKAGASRIEVPLPPIEEQRRIADILDRADSLRTKRRQALTLLDDLTQSIFHEMFGDPILNDHGYSVRPLSEWIDPNRPITYGILKPGEDKPNGVPYVRVVDMKDRAIDPSSLRRTTPAISAQYKRSILATGDLLMSIRGHVGRMAMVPIEAAGANITQDSARLAVAPDSAIYVLEFFRTPSTQFWMRQRTKGAAVQGINLGDLKRLPIPVAPAPEQWRFATRANAVADLRAIAIEQRECADQTFAALQQKAFAGEL